MVLLDANKEGGSQLSEHCCTGRVFLRSQQVNKCTLSPDQRTLYRDQPGQKAPFQMELGLPAAPPVPSEAWLGTRLLSTPQIKVVLVCSTTGGALGQGGT